MTVKTGVLELKVKKVKIAKVYEYKCLGMLFDEGGTIEKHIKAMVNKGIGMIKDIAMIGHQHNVGQMSTQIQLFLYEKVLIPSLTYNLEGVTYWREADITSLEKTQGTSLLKILLKLPDSTPYWGLLNELGKWPLVTRK